MTTAEPTDLHRPADCRPAARVVLLSGPSGAGKSSLADRTGLPVLHLDDFYRCAGDPALPRSAGGTAPDWDSPLSWDADAAMAAITALAGTGRTRVPVYSLPASTVVGEGAVELGGAALFVAEGIFAAEIIARCRAAGVLADALCLHGSPVTTAWRRLRRDLREARKPLPVLLRRGWRLMRTEAGTVARLTALGAEPCGWAAAMARIRAAAAAAARRPY